MKESLASGQKLTYGELLEASLQWGGFLRDLKLNIEPEEVSYWNKTTLIPPRVAIFSPNVIEYIPVMFGSLAAGFSTSCINMAYKVGTCHKYIVILHSSCNNKLCRNYDGRKL